MNNQASAALNLQGNELVSYNNGNLLLGNISFSPNTNVGDYNDWFYPTIYEHHYHHWYPTVSYFPERNKIEQGFKIVTKMLENKIIEKDLTVKEFVKLVNDIAELL